MADATEGWFYADAGGQERGPVSFRVVRANLRIGSLTLDSLVWKNGMADWRPARDVPLFRAAVAAGGSPMFAGGVTPTARRGAGGADAANGVTPSAVPPVTPAAAKAQATSAAAATPGFVEGTGVATTTPAPSKTVRRLRMANPEEWWYLGAGGVEMGPYGVGEVRSMLNDGTITQHTWVWGGATGRWARVLDLPPQLMTATDGGPQSVRADGPAGAAVGGEFMSRGPHMNGMGTGPTLHQPPPMSPMRAHGDALATELAECKAALSKTHELLVAKDAKLKKYKAKLRQAGDELRARDGELAVLREMLAQAREMAVGVGVHASGAVAARVPVRTPTHTNGAVHASDPMQTPMQGSEPMQKAYTRAQQVRSSPQVAWAAQERGGCGAPAGDGGATGEVSGAGSVGLSSAEIASIKALLSAVAV